MAQVAAAALKGEEVAGMRVGVEVTELQQLLQAADHPGANQCGRVELQRLQLVAVAHLGAIDPGGGEHPGGAEHPLHARNVNRVVVSKEAGEPFGVVGFLDVVNLFKQAAAEFIDDVAETETEIERQQRSCDDTQQTDQHQIAAQDEGEVGALHLHGNPGIPFQTGFVDLSEAGGRDRSIRELVEQLMGWCTELLLNALQCQGMGESGKVVLKSCQLLKPVPADEIWTGGQGLPHLDETGPQSGEGVEDAAGQPLLHG